jgi:hypothetical protein
MEGRKEELIKRLAQEGHFTVFVETGTFFGDMLAGLEPYFEKLYSVELSAELYEYAKRRFKKHGQVRLFCGDSRAILPRVLRMFSEPALFWLDAHRIPDVPSWKCFPVAGNMNPLLAELESIKDERHLILVDNVDDLNGENGSPTLKEVQAKVKQIRIEENVLICHPA